MVTESSKARLTIYTTARLRSSARTEHPTVLQVSMKGPSITIDCELTMRLRPPHIAVRKTPPLFGIFQSHHLDLGSPPSHPDQSFSPGLTTLTMKQASRFYGSKALQAHILKLQRQEPMQR